MRIGWGRLRVLGESARGLCDDLATISSCIVLEAVEYLPAAQERTQLQRRMVREAFAEGRDYERARLGLPPTEAGAAATVTGDPKTPTAPTAPRDPHERHLHLVSG